MREAMSVNGNISAGGEIRGTVSGTGAVHGSVSGPAPIHGSTGGMKVLHTDSYAIAVANGFVGTVDEWLESLKGPKGDTGISPVVAVEDIDGGHRVTITDKNGAKQFDVMDGTVTEEQIASAVEDYMAEHPVEVTDIVKTVNGIPPDENGNVVVQVGGGGSGEAGADGFSPIAKVTQTADGAVITITDKSGTTTATIVNGKDGADGQPGEKGDKGDKGDPGEPGQKGEQGIQGIPGADGAKGDKGDTGAQGEPGKDGANGKDGVSATHRWNGTTLTITSASGTSSANLKGEKGDKGDKGDQGEKGETGAAGSNGTNGKDGANGTSVTVKSVSESTADGGSNVVTFSDGKTLNVKNGSKGSAGKTPVRGVDYYTEADKAEFSEYIASELAKRGQLKPEFANSIEECTDTSKLYVLPDGYIYAWMLIEKEVESGSSYTNKLPQATDTDRTTIFGSDYDGDGDNDGYITGKRLSSSGGLSNESAACASGFIFPVAEGSVIRIKGATPIQSSAAAYVITYNSANTKVGYAEMPKNSDKSDWSTTQGKSYYRYKDGVITVTLDSTFGTGYDAIRFSAGTISADTIVTINEEIKEGGGTTIVTEWAWTNTGRAFVAGEYEDRIIDLENTTAQHTKDIAALKKGSVDTGGLDALTWIRQWDSPIYDRTPVWELTTEKAALTSTDKTVAAVYAKYDALMAANPDFITKTDLGLCSDGVTHVYRYDFCEQEPRHQSGFEWSETKPKFIVVTGIHREWNGIYSMYNALAEITTNSELAELRRNVHFIVIPVLSPYSISGPYATVGHAANYNGVEIHRNFEVGFTVANEGTIHYSGETPLSEVESQYLDNILKANTDAAYFLTCHSFDRDKTWGVGFLWGSSATKYMCNMAFRVIDKMGKAWHKKYGTTWEEGIATQNAFVCADTATYPNAKALEDGDYRIGHAALTNTAGCEQRQATKYGIQATNFEVCETMFVLDETMLSAKALTHGTEAYVNFFLTAMNCYDHKDKKQYYVG